MSDSSIYVVCCGLLIVIAIVAIRLIDGRNAKVKSDIEERKRKLREDMTEDELCEFIKNDKLDQYGKSEFGQEAFNGLAQRGTEKSIKFLLDHFSTNTVGSSYYVYVAWAILVISERLNLSIPSDGLFLDKSLSPRDRIRIYEMIFAFNGTVPQFDNLVAKVTKMDDKDDDKFWCWTFLARLYFFGGLGKQEKKLISEMANENAGSNRVSISKEYEKEWDDGSTTRASYYETEYNFIKVKDLLSYVSLNVSMPDRSESMVINFNDVLNHAIKQKNEGKYWSD